MLRAWRQSGRRDHHAPARMPRRMTRQSTRLQSPLLASRTPPGPGAWSAQSPRPLCTAPSRAVATTASERVSKPPARLCGNTSKSALVPGVSQELLHHGLAPTPRVLAASVSLGLGSNSKHPIYLGGVCRVATPLTPKAPPARTTVAPLGSGSSRLLGRADAPLTSSPADTCTRIPIASAGTRGRRPPTPILLCRPSLPGARRLQRCVLQRCVVDNGRDAARRVRRWQEMAAQRPAQPQLASLCKCP